MNRLFYLPILAFSICLSSCEKDQESIEQQADYIDISLGAANSIFTKAGDTRAEVTNNGVTNWKIGNKVNIIDSDEQLQLFTYTLNYPNTDGTFYGKLKGQQGVCTYYSYHNPCEGDEQANSNYKFRLNDPECSSKYVFDIKYEDLEISQNGEPLSFLYGKYCPMVGLPLTFDVNATYERRPRINFYHATALIEARITPAEENSNPERFNRIVLSLEAKNGAKPFNTNVHMLLDKITASPVNIKHFDEVGEKVGKLQTTLNLKKSVNLEELGTVNQSYYSLPIFALPTTDEFEWELFVYFYRDEIDEGVSSKRLSYANEPMMVFRQTNVDDISGVITYGGYAESIDPSSLSDFGMNEEAHRVLD